MAPLIKRLANYTPARRLGAESEVSAAMVFLLSPAAAFISGSCLRVDGAAPNANVDHQRHAGGLDVFAGEYVGGIAAQEHDADLPADENQGRKHRKKIRKIGMMASDTVQIFSTTCAYRNVIVSARRAWVSPVRCSNSKRNGCGRRVGFSSRSFSFGGT